MPRNKLILALVVYVAAASRSLRPLTFSVKFTCQQGQGQATESYRVGNERSLAACASRCYDESACLFFDFSTMPQLFLNNSCRFYRNNSLLAAGHPHRKHCKMMSSRSEKPMASMISDPGRRRKCGYMKDDIANLSTSTIKESVFDPRIGYRQGFLQGIAGKIVYVARAMTNSKVVELELDGWLAHRVVQAQHGIMTAPVPKACFNRLVRELRNENRSWKEITKRRVDLRSILDDLPSACSEKALGANRRIGESARKQLKALRWGYWSLYEPLTSEHTSTISARVLDERRFNRKKNRLRQIWHYGKLFLYGELDSITRMQYLQAEEQGKAKSELRRLQRQRRHLAMLLSLRNARLEYVELDGLGNCVSAGRHDPEHILQSISNRRSSKFRSTLFFRERTWQMMARASAHALKHPFSSTSKKHNRFMDEWSRSFVGHRLGMILGPVAKVAAIAGVVLGTITGGATSFLSIFTAAYFNAGVAQLVSVGMSSATTQAAVYFLLGKLLQEPVDILQTDLLNLVSARLEGTTAMNRFWDRLTNDEEYRSVVWEINIKLQTEIERIMEMHEITQHLKAVKGEEGNDLEEEVRRYVGHLVRSSFVDELTPQIQEKIEGRLSQNTTNFGWLPWRRWRIYREGKSSKALVGKTIRYAAPGRHWTANVSSVLGLGLDNRELDLRSIPYNISFKIELFSWHKNYLSVFDPEAYRRSIAGWLTWHDWTEYREGTSAKYLKNKEIYINVDFPGCAALQGSCAETLKGNNGTGFVVTDTTWILGGSRVVDVDVDGSSTHPCRSAGLELSSSVKDCLLVRDAKAYRKSMLDEKRREMEDQWNNGKLNASFTISQEVVQAMRQVEPGNFRSEAAAANGVLENRCGTTSVELEMQEYANTTSMHGDQDGELHAVEEEIERGFFFDLIRW